MKKFFLITQYLQYILKAKSAHGVHSPFVFDFIHDVLKDKRHYYAFDAIRQLRQAMYQDETLLQIEDFGAGSHKQNHQQRKVKDIARTAGRNEKLAAATEEENEEIPEDIFKQAMDSISENAIISESLAIILGKQGKIDKAIDMYKKLSLRNPEKNLYFADRIKELTTIKDY